MELETGESQLREKVDSIQKRMIIWQVLTTGSLIALFIAVMLLALNKREAVGIDKSSTHSESDHRSQVKFIDGIGEVTLAGGMIRMDLSRLETDENGEQVLGNTGQLVLPPDGFLRSFSAMENLVQQLKDAGLVESKDNKRKYSPKD
jgi:hypothetical protein